MILDQYGQRLDEVTFFSDRLSGVFVSKLLEPCRFAEMEKIHFLRRSCGVEPKVKQIRFRRYGEG